jgi:hypothetical protein
VTQCHQKHHILLIILDNSSATTRVQTTTKHVQPRMQKLAKSAQKPSQLDGKSALFAELVHAEVEDRFG